MPKARTIASDKGAMRNSRDGKTHLVLCCLCDILYPKPLASVVLNPRKDHERDSGTLARDDGKDVFFSEGVLAWTRGKLEHGAGGVETV